MQRDDPRWLLLRNEGRILEMRTVAAARSWHFMACRRRRAADTSICRDLIALPHLLCGHLLALCRRARYAHSWARVSRRIELSIGLLLTGVTQHRHPIVSSGSANRFQPFGCNKLVFVSRMPLRREIGVTPPKLFRFTLRSSVSSRKDYQWTREHRI